jgi:hypothetical protein
LTAIRDYLRWIRRWHVDYTTDEWREQNEQRWEAFCRWRAGELPQDIDTAVRLAKLQIINAGIEEFASNVSSAIHKTFALIDEVVMPLIKATHEAIETAMPAFTAFAEAMNNIGLPGMFADADNMDEQEDM